MEFEGFDRGWLGEQNPEKVWKERRCKGRGDLLFFITQKFSFKRNNNVSKNRCKSRNQ